MKRKQTLTYGFDRVFGEDATQESVFECTGRPLVKHTLSGFDATVFAYGATGCGKTHTITGTNQDPGIISRTIDALYDAIAEIKQEQSSTSVSVSVSYLEVYNETIRDLLSNAVNLDLREDDSRVVVAGLSRHQVHDARNVMKLLNVGNSNRAQAFTFANAVSSRSHAVLQLYVSVEPSSSAKARTATMSIIDLAGSERAAATMNNGERLVEGANINRSLLALGNCINALCADKPTFVPYRDSKLTRLLKYSLSGLGCKVVMIANISPAAVHCEETGNTLKYANRAKKIRARLAVDITASPAVDSETDHYPRIIAALREQVRQLRDSAACIDDSKYEADFQLAFEKAAALDAKILEVCYLLSEYKDRHDHNMNRLFLFESVLSKSGHSDLQIRFVNAAEQLFIANSQLSSDIADLEAAIVKYESQLSQLETSFLHPNTRIRFALDILRIERINKINAHTDTITKMSSSRLEEQFRTLVVEYLGFGSSCNKEDFIGNLLADDLLVQAAATVQEHDMLEQETTFLDTAHVEPDAVKVEFRLFDDVRPPVPSAFEESQNSQNTPVKPLANDADMDDVTPTRKSTAKLMTTKDSQARTIDSKRTHGSRSRPPLQPGVTPRSKTRLNSVLTPLRKPNVSRVGKKSARQSMIPVMNSTRSLLQETPKVNLAGGTETASTAKFSMSLRTKRSRK